MGDIGDRLRSLFDEEARPIDPEYIPHTVRRKSSMGRMFGFGGRPGWQVGIAAGLISLVVGGSALLFRMNGDGGMAEQTVSATQPNEADTATSVAEAGIEWTEGSLPEEFNVHTITAAGGYFIGLAWDEIEEPDPRTRLWLSEDGANWEAINVDATAFGMRAGYFQTISAIGNGFIAIVKGESLTSGFAEQILVTSTDARVWVAADIGGSGEYPVSVAGGTAGGIAVMRSRDGDRDFYDIWRSIDGVTWTVAASRTFSGGSTVELIGDRFYLWRQGYGEGVWSSSDGSEWTLMELPQLGTDSNGWEVPAGSPGGLLLFTGRGASGSQLWLNATDNTWMDVTPEEFDVPLVSGGGFGDQFIGSSDGGPSLIMELGSRSGGPRAQGSYIPATIWWTLDGSQWTELPGSEAFGLEGTIRLASAKGNKIVVVYDSEPDRVGSLWTGVVTGVADVVAPQGPPHLVLELPDTRIVDISDIFDGSTGTPVGIHTSYDTRLGPYGCYGRLTLLRVQQPGVEFAGFDNLTFYSESTDIVLVGDREVTVYMIPDEAIVEGNYDLGILRWMEAPGYEAFLIPWGVGPEEALTLLDGLKVVSDSEWDQLAGLIDTSTTTYPVECDEPLGLFPRVVINLPGFEIVGGSEAWDVPAPAHGEWQFRIGETTGTITLDSDQTTPSDTFVDFYTLEEVTIVGLPGLVMPGLLARHDDGFIVEWQLDTRFTVSVDGNDIDPLTLIDAIGEVDEATWIQLLPDTAG